MHWETIVTLVAVTGSAFTIYFNLKKFGDNIKQEAIWRTDINRDIKSLLEKVNSLIKSLNDTAGSISELITARARIEQEIDTIKKEQNKMWLRIDENRNLIYANKENISAIKAVSIKE